MFGDKSNISQEGLAILFHADTPLVSTIQPSPISVTREWGF